MQNKWIRNSIQLLILLMLLMSCNVDTIEPESGHQEKEVKETSMAIEIMSLDIEPITMSYSDIYGKAYEYSAVFYENQHYVTIEDFIEIVDDINLRNKAIIDLTTESYDRATNTLHVTLQKSNRHYLERTKSEMYSELYAVEKHTIEGDDLDIVIDLNEELFHSILVKDDIYLPLQIINYEMYKDSVKIKRLDEHAYENHQINITDDFDEKFVYDDVNLFNNDYEKSYVALLEYFKSTGAITEKIGYDQITSYTSYMAHLIEISTYLEDYHYNILGDNSEFHSSRLSVVDRQKINNSFMYNRYKDKAEIDNPVDMENPLRWEVVNDDILYLDCDTFFINDFLYKMKLNQLEKELSSNNYSTLIIDLRYNSGGNGVNAMKLFNKIAGDTYSYSIGFLYNDNVYSTHTFNMKKIEPSSKEYDVILLLNEHSASASISFANVVKDNMDTYVIGHEPLDKQSGYISIIQALDGTLIFKSQRSFVDFNKDGMRFDDVVLVDEELNDDEILKYLENLEVNLN
ncbi:MAG: hypothetical protein JEZ08_22315 [Clostridiales bacterium]|nr:hypothetical protein [Clostridiales bacterium]